MVVGVSEGGGNSQGRLWDICGTITRLGQDTGCGPLGSEISEDMEKIQSTNLQVNMTISSGVAPSLVIFGLASCPSAVVWFRRKKSSRWKVTWVWFALEEPGPGTFCDPCTLSSFTLLTRESPANSGSSSSL